MCWARPAAGTFAPVQCMNTAWAQPRAVSRCYQCPSTGQGKHSPQPQCPAQDREKHNLQPQCPAAALGSPGMAAEGAENRAELKGEARTALVFGRSCIRKSSVDVVQLPSVPEKGGEMISLAEIWAVDPTRLKLGYQLQTQIALSS